MDSVHYSITPISCGILDQQERSNLTLGKHQGEKIVVPTIMWLVQGAGRTVIVDTGPGDIETVRLIGRNLTREEEPAGALERLKVRPRDVSSVVLSHLHYDHSGGLDMFPEAAIYVQRSELHWAISPLPNTRLALEWGLPGNRLPRWLNHRHRMKVIDGDFQLAPGLQLIHLPGHTPGCMGLCCDTSAGRHMIACDAVPTYENIADNVPTGIYVNLEDVYRSMERCRQLADVVLPSHDMRVFETTTYPAPIKTMKD